METDEVRFVVFVENDIIYTIKLVTSVNLGFIVSQVTHYLASAFGFLG